MPLPWLFCFVVGGDVSVREATGSNASTAPSAAVTASPKEVVARSVKDVERSWTAQYPALGNGAAFSPVQVACTRTPRPTCVSDQPTVALEQQADRGLPCRPQRWGAP
jgi:hypothetical protein